MLFLILRKKKIIAFTKKVWPEDQPEPWFRGNNLVKTRHTHLQKEDWAQRPLKKSYGDARRMIPYSLRAVLMTQMGVLPPKVSNKKN